MFSFLNGTILFAAAAALIPLIIHLFSRRRVKVVEFSSLRHLKAMQKRQVRRLKIRQVLLLLLRMLVILMVVLAFARPTTRGGAVGSHASVSAVILFDNSASMNRYVSDGNLFEIARKRTRELLNTFGQSDQVMLLPLDPSSKQSLQPAFGSPAVALEQLELLKPAHGEADEQNALESAVRLLSSATNVNREIYLISDRQRHSLPDREPLKESDARVYIVNLPLEDNDNLGIVGLDFGGQLIQPGLDFNLSATVKNYGASASGDLIASLFIDDKRVAQTSLKVAANSETAVRFTRAVSQTGFHAGYVELSDDKFLNDNRYYFSFRIPDRFNLLIIDGDEGARYMALALVPSVTLPSFWSAKTARPDELSGIQFEGYDVVILAGSPRLESPYHERLKAFVRSGKALFLTYGGATDIQYFNAAWSQVTGIAYDEPIKQNFSRAGYYTLQSIDMDHPVFSVFGFERNKPPEIKFFTLPTAHLIGKTRTLMSFTGDRPALVEASYGSGRVLTFTGPVSPQYTDLPGHAFFVPFISRTAEYLAADLSSLELRLFTSSAVTRPITLKGTVTYSVQMQAPDHVEYDLSPEDRQGSLVVVARPIGEPGIYSLQYVGKEIDRFAVNINPAECDLTSADVDQTAAAMGAKDYHVLKEGETLATAIAGFRFGRELWQLFLWLALILLAVEMILARSAQPEE